MEDLNRIKVLPEGIREQQGLQQVPHPAGGGDREHRPGQDSRGRTDRRSEGICDQQQDQEQGSC